MNPTHSATVFIKDLKVMDVFSLKCSTKGPEGIAVNLTSKTNGLLGDGTY